MRKALEPLYRREAKTLLTRLTEQEVRRSGWNGGQTPPVRITGAKTRWGSCSGRNTLNFSWRLLAAEEDAVRYVVIHELAHTAEHNHSSRFWALVESACPDWAAASGKASGKPVCVWSGRAGTAEIHKKNSRKRYFREFFL